MKTYINGSSISSYDIGELCQFTFSGFASSLHPDLVSKYIADFGDRLDKNSDMALSRDFVGVVVDKEESDGNLRLVVLARNAGQPVVIKYHVTGTAGQIVRDPDVGGTADLTRNGKGVGGTAELTRGSKATGGTADLTRGNSATGGTAELTR